MSSLVSESDSCIAERSSLETQIEDERASSRRMQSSLESSRSELRSLKNEFEIKSESCKNEIARASSCGGKTFGRRVDSSS